MDQINICNCQNNVSTRDCIIAQKIFDQCRLQVCLTPETIGPARINNGGNCCRTSPSTRGDVVSPPGNAVSVAMRNLCVTNVNVIDKSPCSLRSGYWDITVKFTFTYCLVFFDTDGQEISRVNAYSTYTTTLCLYGGPTMCVSTFNELCPDTEFNGPFVNVEANGVALAACLSYPCPVNPVWGGNRCGCGCGCGCNCGCTSPGNIVNNCECTSPSTLSAVPIAVNVTIGVFAVIKLFRLSNMSVENFGNCMPEDCAETSPSITNDPCGFFEELDFPVNLFAPQSTYEASSYEGTTDFLPGGSACCTGNTGCGGVGGANTGRCNCGGGCNCGGCRK